MSRHRPEMSCLNSRQAAFGGILWCVLAVSPAASCSFVDTEVSILASIALSKSYWIGTALLVAAIFLLDVLGRKRSLAFVIGLLIVVFHPAWTVPPLFYPDCTFTNVEASQWAAMLLTFVLVFRAFRYFRRLRPRQSDKFVKNRGRRTTLRCPES